MDDDVGETGGAVSALPVVNTNAVENRGNGHGLSLQPDGPASIQRNLSAPPRDPRDHTAPTPVVSRPASPYTLNPPIDFDGLSWPSTRNLLSTDITGARLVANLDAH